MFNNKELLNRIFIEDDSGLDYVILIHRDKTWIMPKACMGPAFDMYQPSTNKGKLLKFLGKHFFNVNFIMKKIGIYSNKFSVNHKLIQVLDKSIGNNNYFIAAYMGDTSSGQNDKATLQIYNSNHILAYAKITQNSLVRKNFDREIDNLNFLKEKKINHIPKVLIRNTIDDMDIFVQSTNKNIGEKVKLKFNKSHMEFVKGYVTATKKKLEYKDSDIYIYIKYLKDNINIINVKEEADIVSNSIKIVEKRLEKRLTTYSFFHGDFTPWNVYYTEGELNAFDFEYSSRTMPEYMDIFHYITQLTLLGFNGETGTAISNFKKHKKLLEDYIFNPELLYMCYLLFIISFYIQRTEAEFDIKDNNYYNWIGILDYLNDKIKE